MSACRLDGSGRWPFQRFKYTLARSVVVLRIVASIQRLTQAYHTQPSHRPKGTPVICSHVCTYARWRCSRGSIFGWPAMQRGYISGTLFLGCSVYAGCQRCRTVGIFILQRLKDAYFMTLSRKRYVLYDGSVFLVRTAPNKESGFLNSMKLHKFILYD